MAVDLHFICKHGERHAHCGDQVFETGNWSVAEKTAAAAVGGRIYLHEKQKDPAWHGGTIISWHASEVKGRIAFKYRVDGPFRVKCSGGWGQEKAVVRQH